VLVWAAPLLAGLILAVPFAVVTASPRFGAFLTRIGLCAIPEERERPRDLQKIAGPDLTLDGPDMPAGSSGALSPVPSS
jgi:membrane glycosyltransferase